MVSRWSSVSVAFCPCRMSCSWSVVAFIVSGAMIILNLFIVAVIGLFYVGTALLFLVLCALATMNGRVEDVQSRRKKRRRSESQGELAKVEEPQQLPEPSLPVV